MKILTQKQVNEQFPQMTKMVTYTIGETAFEVTRRMRREEPNHRKDHRYVVEDGYLMRLRKRNGRWRRSVGEYLAFVK